MYRHSTPEALALKRELEDRGVITVSEQWDGYKHIDLVVHRARLNIEVDGIHHYTNADQIVADLKRSHHSDFKGYDTIHIPNVFVNDKRVLQQIADALAKVAAIRARRLGVRLPYHHYSRRGARS